MKYFGQNAIEEIEKNPYVLLDIAYGVDFKKIDKMAIDLGVSKNDSKRIESAVKYGLAVASYNGNTCVLKDNLIQFVVNLLDVSSEDVEDGIINLKVQNKIYVEKQNDEWIYLDTLYICEKNIAEKLVALKNYKNVKQIKNFQKNFSAVEKSEDIYLSDKQKEAIQAVNENNVCVITGGPGTGKTTIIKFIIDMYKNENKKVILCAPTGRAAKRMSEATGEEATTIHRLLELGKTEDTLDIEKLDYQIAPIDADVIIVDEMSMVDAFVMNYILKGIYLGTKLVLVGDINQLPAVGPGSVLQDIILSETIATIELNQIFRQAAKSKIITNAHKVNRGESFIEKEQSENSLNDFFYINETSQDKMLKDVISLCSGRLEKYGSYDFFKNIQVLTPTKKGPFGTKELNKTLQNVLNPNETIEKQHGDRIFRIGDRVMQIKNNYDIFWQKDNNETGTGIFNGELGKITDIDDIDKTVEILFDDDKRALYEYTDLEQIEHAYCITIHKSQGSEFDVVIMCLPQAAPMLLTRNLLYTGITRAKELLIILGPKSVVEYMINNEDTKKRNTGLQYKLENL